MLSEQPNFSWIGRRVLIGVVGTVDFGTGGFTQDQTNLAIGGFITSANHCRVECLNRASINVRWSARAGIAKALSQGLKTVKTNGDDKIRDIIDRMNRTSLGNWRWEGDKLLSRDRVVLQANNVTVGDREFIEMAKQDIKYLLSVVEGRLGKDIGIALGTKVLDVLTDLPRR